MVSVASGLVVAGVAAGSAPVGAAPRHEAAAAALAKGTIVTASLVAVSEAPHSSVAWAYGTGSTAKGVGTLYALRRSGGHWAKKSMKAPKDYQLFGIAAGSPRSVWIVGNTTTGATVHSLVEHSSGGGFKPFKTSIGKGQLLSVSASSASNAWAVGDGLLSAAGPLIAHWNGKSWKRVSETSLAGDSFSLVSVSSPNNVWFYGTSATGNVIGVWNGHKLTVTAFTPPGPLASISTTSAKNAWGVGIVVIGTSGRSRLFADHWNGKKWTATKLPTIGHSDSGPTVSAAGSRVSIGAMETSKSGLDTAAIAFRYAGGKWKSAPTASPGHQSQISSISLSTKGGAAVGSWSVRGPCGFKHPTLPLPFAESLVGTSWRQNSVAKFRFGLAHLRMAGFAPSVASC
jgi:hypothetical protein